MAATEDRATTQRPGFEQGIEVSAGEELYAGTLVCYGADGYLVDGEDLAGLVFAGVLRDSVDNVDGADGDETAEVYTKGQFLFEASGLVITDIGQKVYLIDNETVGLAENADVDQYVYVGTIAEFVSATECWVDIDPHAKPDVRQFTVQVAGTNAAALNLAALAADFGGGNFHVDAVQSMEAYVTATKASAGMKVAATNYTVAAGVITTVTDESANTLVITFTGKLL